MKFGNAECKIFPTEPFSNYNNYHNMGVLFWQNQDGDQNEFAILELVRV